MSVNLKCPNCGAIVGEATHEDGYVNKFYHNDCNGEPYCDNCQSYRKYMTPKKHILIDLLKKLHFSHN